MFVLFICLSWETEESNAVQLPFTSSCNDWWYFSCLFLSTYWHQQRSLLAEKKWSSHKVNYPYRPLSSLSLGTLSWRSRKKNNHIKDHGPVEGHVKKDYGPVEGHVKGTMELSRVWFHIQWWLLSSGTNLQCEPWPSFGRTGAAEDVLLPFIPKPSDI